MFVRAFYPAVTLAAAGLGYFCYTIMPDQGPAPVLAKPWIETGYPVQHSQTWRIRVCHLQHKLLIADEYNPPEPLHAVLKLNPKAKPFFPAGLSATSSDPQYYNVQIAIGDAFAEQTGTQVAQMAARMTNFDENNPDYERILNMMSVVSLLSDDEIRAHYAHFFVPVLVSDGLLDRFKSEEKIRNERVEALKDLCA